MDLRGLILLTAVALGTSGYALECPSSIQYKGGRLLKSGSTYYYPSGRLLKSGSTLYYANGRLLRSGTTFYYGSGRLLKSGSTLYYPEGRLLKSGSTYYYPSGRLLKSGSTYYYDNGRLARSGSTLYRPDGSITAFPIRLKAQIGELGDVLAYVTKDSDQVDVYFSGLSTEDERVTLISEWNGETFSLMRFYLDTGYENELVGLDINGDEAVCSLLDGEIHAGASFTLYGAAATVAVNVNAGYDAAEVRHVLEEALQALRSK